MILTKPNIWNMCSDEGNELVAEIVERAEEENLSWPEVWKRLYLLHKRKGFLSAMDRDVTEKVYNHLGFTSPFYFYGLTVNNTTLFDVFPELARP